MLEEVVMFNPTATMIHHAIARLQQSYCQMFGNLTPSHTELIGQIAATTLNAIARTDALYHDVEHTILVTLVGQEILRGKQLLEATVSPDDWLHFIVALLCHDIGYLKGICRQDCVEEYTYTTGQERIAIAPGQTDASLTPYHVDRGKLFVAENLGYYRSLDIVAIQQMIELTRFPIPNDEAHQDTSNFPGLARAADFIGQLGDSRYLEKLPALFHEFEEVGTNKSLGYQHPGDLRMGYPHFFQTVVQPLIQPAIAYLQVTQQGQQILNQLYRNVSVVEWELKVMAEQGDRGSQTIFIRDHYHFFLQELETQHTAETFSPNTL